MIAENIVLKVGDVVLISQNKDGCRLDQRHVYFNPEMKVHNGRLCKIRQVFFRNGIPTYYLFDIEHGDDIGWNWQNYMLDLPFEDD